MKTCIGCNIKKEDKFFNIKQSRCIECQKIYAKEYRDNNKEKIKKYYDDNREFILDYKSKYREDNKEDIIVYNKDYYKANKNKIKENSKRYYYKNSINIKKKRQFYYTDNKSKILKSNNVFKNKKRQDPGYKLRCNISRAILSQLTRNNSHKNNCSCFQYLDYTIKELKTHLENKFEYWMNWNNYGVYNITTWMDEDPLTWVWNIDHIIPQSLLVFDSMEHPNFKKCWALENLRPYSAKQNIIDGNRRR